MSFIPMFSKKLSNKNEANIFFSEIFNFLFWSLLLIVSIFEILMPALVFILAPGFLQDPEKIDLVVDLARISFPYLFFYISCHTPMRGLEFNREVPARSINANICKYFNDNCFITCADNGNTNTRAAALLLMTSFLISGVLQLALCIYGCKKHDFFPKVKLPKISDSIKKFMILSFPAIGAGGIIQINILIGSIICII